MSQKVKVVLNTGRVQSVLLKSEATKGMLQGAAEMLLQRLPEGYATDAFSGENRLNVSVWPDSEEAVRDNLENNTLEKAVHGL